ncbi:MAG: hypothetical protein J0L93_08225 [Deltaproteobacteria bacterium]|nr:hypothetical protein [Deltaproteobacteria bacterium]
MATPNYRTELNSTQPTTLLNWKSILGGFFIAGFIYAILIALGLGIGGLTLKGITQDGLIGLSIGTGIWMIISTLIAVFCGAFFAARLAPFIESRAAAMQGLVVTSLFFAVMVFGAGTSLMFAGKIVGYTVGAAGVASTSLLDQPAVTAAIENAIGNLNLKDDVSVVIKGVATRLANGNEQAAKNYLAREAGLTPAQADQRIADLLTNFNRAVAEATEVSGNAISAMGWTMFLTFLLGGLAGYFGGGAGATMNNRRPFVSSNERPISRAA